MNIGVTGSTGLIGSSLVRFLKKDHNVFAIVRDKSLNSDTIYLNYLKNEGDFAKLEKLDALIHLAGTPVAKRWTKSYKDEIYSSRIGYTSFLVDSLSKLNKAPEIFICASAIGYYGDRKEEILTEESNPGDGFLAKVCVDWEKTSHKLTELGIRVINLRTGVVLAPEGGFLKQLLPLFKLGLGAYIGSGQNYVSFISLDDEIRAIGHLLASKTSEGPYNLVAPNPVLMSAFLKALASSLKRPLFLKIPEAALRLVFPKDQVSEVLLASQRVIPKKLENEGFEFSHGRLQEVFDYYFK